MKERQVHRNGFTGTESYMNENQLAYFQDKLLGIIRQLSEKVENTRRQMQQANSRRADMADRSELETWRENLLLNCEHCQKIIRQSEAALKRIRNRTFGYCALTGVKIGLQRLEILPWTHLSVDAQELFESSVGYSRWN
ncbi:MAG: transcriptional regulator, TraR/DksA family protein [Desulfobacterales bacterium]